MLSFSAKILSFVFHPLFLCSYATILLVLFLPYKFAGMDSEGDVKIFAAVFLNTAFFPIVVLLLMKKLDFIQDFYLRTNKERIVPFLAISFFYTWAFISIKNTDLPPVIYQILLGATISLFSLFFINIFNKISIHATGMGAFLIVMFYLLMNSPYNLSLLFVICLLVAGVLGSTRLYLKEHKPFDVYFGYLVGILSQIIAFNF